VRGVLIVLAATGILFATAAPAAPPEYPVSIIDVRHWEAYAESHIKGARSMPLRVVADRAAEISKTGLVVFY